MTLTFPQNVVGTNGSLTLNNVQAFLGNTISRKVSLLSSVLLGVFFSAAQSVSPSTINTSGGSASSGNYQFEWSIGESTSITTMTNSNLIVTAGVLQPFMSSQITTNVASIFLPGEIKIYPNPTRNIIEINMLYSIKGKNQLELFDINGRKVMEKQFEYNGTGSIEKWDLSRLAAGQYFLNIQLISPVSGTVVKKGAFKILKIQ